MCFKEVKCRVDYSIGDTVYLPNDISCLCGTRTDEDTVYSSVSGISIFSNGDNSGNREVRYTLDLSINGSNKEIILDEKILRDVAISTPKKRLVRYGYSTSLDKDTLAKLVGVSDVDLDCITQRIVSISVNVLKTNRCVVDLHRVIVYKDKSYFTLENDFFNEPKLIEKQAIFDSYYKFINKK